MRAYKIHKSKYLELFGYTVLESTFVSYGKVTQQELHKTAYEHANKTLKYISTEFQPANQFLKEAADPDIIPTQKDFDQWMNKRKIINQLKNM